MNDMIKKFLQIDQEILVEQIKHDFLSKKTYIFMYGFY